MPEDGAVAEETRQGKPLDLMVATFADRQAARDAYQTLKTMDKEGTLSLDGAVVIDRNEMGKVRLEGATLPGWLWGVVAGLGALMLGAAGVVVFVAVMATRGLRSSMRGGGGYSASMEPGPRGMPTHTPMSM